MLKLTGNDIVDLTLPETLGKASDTRYTNHICAEEEYNFLASASDRHIALWAIWAAKEAAFKVVKKINPKLGFSPKKYVVDCSGLNTRAGNKILTGAVSYNHYFISVRWFITGDYVHCIAVWSNQSRLSDNLRSAIWNTNDKNFYLTTQNFSTREMLSIRSKESRQVRILTKRLLSDNGVKNVEIVRDSADGRLEPPYVLQDKLRCAKYDISMSHHGRFRAASALL